MAASSSISDSFLLLLLFFAFFELPPPANSVKNSVNFTFSSFPFDRQSELNLTRDAYFYKDKLSLTNNAIGDSRQDSCGRATYRSTVHLWDRESMALADFSTTFGFAIVGNKSADEVADGLAFFLASVGAKFGKNEQAAPGGHFCLFSNPRNNNSYLLDPIVAVEIDTYGNPGFDPPDARHATNHLGIDIHSVYSSKTSAAWNQTADKSLQGEVHIDYNATTFNLSAVLYLNDQTQPLNQVDAKTVSGIVDLRDALSEWVTVGFAGATGGQVESHEIHSWHFTSSNLEEKLTAWKNGTQSNTDHKMNDKNILGFVVIPILAGIAGVLSLILIIQWRRSARNYDRELSRGPIEMAIDVEIENEGGPKRFTYGELFNATNGFSEDGVLGRGGFGSVHKGFLEGLNIHVAVKKLSKDSRQGRKEYISEVRAISRLRHKNLVKLVGWCHENGELILVYQFMPNASLDLHLFNSRNLPISWPKRLNIAKGLASALFYLHEGGEECILHRDIKSSNVMLDSDFNARLGDFGLARVIEYSQAQDGYQSSLLAGSTGYLAPERYFWFKATKESDIYSFGVVLLEIACGRRPIEIQAVGRVAMVEWVWNLHGEGMVIDAADERLEGEFDESEMVRLMVTGLWCAHPDYKLRPSVEQVVSVLNYGAPLPPLPPKMPVPAYRINHSPAAGSTVASGSMASNISPSN